MKVIESIHAVQRVENFKYSKNRSKRLYKKLLKRYNNIQCYDKPCVYVLNNCLYAHPDIVKQLRKVKLQ
jgi:hypothetical protein